ncbi:hypothetical protein HPB48_015240 [Haemaphysalis longicornis]|uniref:Uncharacterized protein n=1 Tax=Haemaphysalis longicornis TaxID=44386 RepID=A0A9J6FIF6_HAELO|nr:hypothetical protein HPB48_015240 [Haemaphysalis longicornis]
MLSFATCNRRTAAPSVGGLRGCSAPGPACQLYLEPSYVWPPSPAPGPGFDGERGLPCLPGSEAAPAGILDSSPPLPRLSARSEPRRVTASTVEARRDCPADPVITAHFPMFAVPGLSVIITSDRPMPLANQYLNPIFISVILIRIPVTDLERILARQLFAFALKQYRREPGRAAGEIEITSLHGDVSRIPDGACAAARAGRLSPLEQARPEARGGRL